MTRDAHTFCGEPRSRFLEALLLSLGVALALAGCSDPVSRDQVGSPESGEVDAGSAPDAETVATFGEGSRITLADMDQLILSMPPGNRTVADASFTDWYGNLVRGHLINEIVLEEADKNGIDELPEFLEEAREIRRKIYSDYRLRKALQAMPALSEKEISARFEEEKAELYRPEIRRTYHIFLRFPSDEAKRNEIIDRLENLRDRVRQGENFGLLATQFSESESRTRQGKLGDLKQGELPDPTNSVIFSLKEGEVSDPVVAQGGAHLFFVENVVAEKAASFEESRPVVEELLARERVRETLTALGESCQLPTNHFSPSGDELRELLSEGDGDTVLFGLGTFELRREEFLQIVSNVRRRAAGGSVAAPSALQIYEEIKNREILFQDTLADPKAPRERLEQSVQTRRDDLLLAHAKRRLSVAWLNSRTDILQPFYRNNEKRFRTVPRVHLAGLNVPIDASAPERMKILEASHEDLTSEEGTWEELATRVDGKYSDWGWFEPTELARTYPRAANQAFGMDPGEISAPYSSGDWMRLFTVLEQEKPQVIPFEVSKTKVIDHYLAANGPEVFKQLSEELLESYQAAVFPENFPDPLEVIPTQPQP